MFINLYDTYAKDASKKYKLNTQIALNKHLLLKDTVQLESCIYLYLKFF